VLRVLGMKFPTPSVGVKDVKRKYHAAELEEKTPRAKRRAKGGPSSQPE
jgi:hypothetical protein